MLTKDFWDKLFPKYSDSVVIDKNADFAYEKQVNGLSLLSMCDNTGNALDIGCGDGRFTRELEARYSKVYGIDFSKKMLNRAKKRCIDTKFYCHDLEKPFPDFNLKFDVVTCKNVLMYIANMENIGRETSKILTAGGYFVLSVTHPLKWVIEHKRGNITDLGYKNYLSEVAIQGRIANDDKLGATFINRTFESYVNTFTKHGLVLDTVLETGVPDVFVIKYPRYLEFQKKPYRLNMRFVKK